MNRQEYVQKLNEEFAFFLQELWTCLHVGELHWSQVDAADWLQNGPQFRGLLGFRGFSKTWMAAAYSLWRLRRNPQLQIKFVSESKGFSESTLLMMRNWMDYVPFLADMRPDTRRGQRDSSQFIDVGTCPTFSKDGSLSAQGMTGQLTGGRSHLIVADDLETLENAFTRTQRDRHEERVVELSNMLLPGGEVVILATRHHDEDSLYDRLAENRGYVFRAYPPVYPRTDELDKIPGLAPIIDKLVRQNRATPDDAIWPERFGMDWIAEKKATGKRNWGLQFMMKRQLDADEKYPLRCKDLIVFPVHRDKAPGTIVWGVYSARGPTTREDIPCPGFSGDGFHAPAHQGDEWFSYSGTRAYLDPAGRGADEASWAIVAELHGYLYVKTVQATQNSIAEPEEAEAFVRSLREHRATSCIVEQNFGGEGLIELLKPIVARLRVMPGEKDESGQTYPTGWSCKIEGTHSSGQKELRIINAIEPVISQHRLVVSEQTARDAKLMYQLTRITSQRNSLEHDDRIEALAGAVKLWNTTLSTNADDQSERKLKERLRKRQLEILGVKENQSYIRHSWANYN